MRAHWSVRARMAKAVRGPVHKAIAAALPRGATLPVRVVLTRIAPKSLDGDNLTSALKAARDGVADAFDVDDRDSRYTWVYDQRAPRVGDMLVHRPPRIAGGRRARAALSNGYGVVIDIEWPEGT